MAFKIESIDKMSKISDTLSGHANEAIAEHQKTVIAVDELSAIMSGRGVGEALQKLRHSITTNTQDAVKVLNDVSLFIKTQVASYSTNEESTASTLNDIENALNDINI